MNKENEKSLEQLLNALEEEIIEHQITNTAFTEQTIKVMRTLASKDYLNTFKITKLLLEKIMATGEIKAYTKKELLLILPWKNTQLWVKLGDLVKEGILISEKRKYQVNVEHPFVKRMKRVMRTSMEELDFEKEFADFLCETKSIIQMLTDKEPELEQENKDEEKLDLQKHYRQVTTNELEAFVNDLRTTYFGLLYNSNEEEITFDLAKLFEKNILMTIGMTEIKE